MSHTLETHRCFFDLQQLLQLTMYVSPDIFLINGIVVLLKLHLRATSNKIS